jgi:Divergent InlB B-repeat domain
MHRLYVSGRQRALRPRLAGAAFAAALLALALALPVAASAANPTFSVTTTGEGEGEVECEFVEPVEGEPEPEEYSESCPETPTSYPKNTKVEILPEAEEPEFEFAGFRNGTGNAEKCNMKLECKVTLQENTAVEARFDYVTFALKLKTAGDGMGAVECEVVYVPTSEYPSEEECEAEAGHPSEVRYPYGTELILTAKGSESEFLGWGGGGCEDEEEEECYVTMEGVRNVTATFKSTAERTLTIEESGPGTVTSSPAGIACGSTCSHRFLVGTTVTLTAAPAPGSLFEGWAGGGCKGIVKTCTLTISADTTVAAEFEPIPPPDLEEEEEEELLGGRLGRAKAAGVAKVKGGRAALKLTCSGGPCKGALKLTARLKQGRKIKTLTIGKASFKLAAGAAKTLKVKLSAPAKRELAKGKTLRAKLSGTGIAASTVKLKPAASHS